MCYTYSQNSPFLRSGICKRVPESACLDAHPDFFHGQEITSCHGTSSALSVSPLVGPPPLGFCGGCSFC